MPGREKYSQEVTQMITLSFGFTEGKVALKKSSSYSLTVIRVK